MKYLEYLKDLGFRILFHARVFGRNDLSSVVTRRRSNFVNTSRILYNFT